MKLDMEQTEIRSFYTKNNTITETDDLLVTFNDFKLEIFTRTDNFQESDSEWWLQ